MDRSEDRPARPAAAARLTPLPEIALLFLRLGSTAFGGPAAHVAMMEDEVVRRREWLSREEFLDFLGATNLIPGPNSTELAIHIGRARRGWPGLLVAGTCFIVPAALIVGMMAWGYVRYGSLPAVAGILYGVKPVVIAIILQAVWRLGRTAVRTPLLAGLAVAATVGAAVGGNELLILAAAGLVAAAWSGRRTGALPALIPIGGAGGGVAAASAFGLGPMFAIFLKIGAVLFGGGYVLVAFLRADFVERLHWLTERQLLDAVAVGQVTPGPVFTTATFVGYLLGGTPGAAAATLGIFLPAFVFVALSGLVLPRLRRSPTARAVLDGVNVASLALMAVVSWQLGRAAIVDPLTAALGIAALILLLRYRINSAWLVLGGALAGSIATALR